MFLDGDFNGLARKIAKSIAIQLGLLKSMHQEDEALFYRDGDLHQPGKIFLCGKAGDSCADDGEDICEGVYVMEGCGEVGLVRRVNESRKWHWKTCK